MCWQEMIMFTCKQDYGIPGEHVELCPHMSQKPMQPQGSVNFCSKVRPDGSCPDHLQSWGHIVEIAEEPEFERCECCTKDKQAGLSDAQMKEKRGLSGDRSSYDASQFSCIDFDGNEQIREGRSYCEDTDEYEESIEDDKDEAHVDSGESAG